MLRFVKLLETVTGPSEPGLSGHGADMSSTNLGWTGTVITRATAAIAVAMMLSGAAFAQSQGNGVSNFLGNIFGQKSAPAPQAAIGRVMVGRCFCRAASPTSNARC